MKKPEKKNILVSVPMPLIKKLDTVAKRQSRSRTSMVCILLDQVLNAPKVQKEEKVAA
jgi:metal-responsive CopG/Arc/MetJ family transcriptional regulator